MTVFLTLIMKVFIRIVFISFLFSTSSFSQNNLVLNPSFEDHKTCTYYSNGVVGAIDTSVYNPKLVPNWFSASLFGTPDYLNKCWMPTPNYVNKLGVPKNSFSYQYPVFPGNAYAHIYITAPNTTTVEAREYLQTKLLTKLKSGQRYCVGMYANLAIDDSTSFFYAGDDVSASKDLGILLSSKRVFNNGTDNTKLFVIEDNPQVKATNFLQDTLNWELVSSSVLANGDEQWLTIGNFQPQYQLNNLILVDKPGPFSSIAYNIDNVFVIPQDDGAWLSNDTSFCTKEFPFKLHALSGGQNYKWDNGDTTTEIIINSPGTYTVKANYGGCVITDTIHILQKPDPVLKLNDINICEKELPFHYSIPSKADFDKILWSDGTQGADVLINTDNDLVVSASNQCVQLVDTLHIKIYKNLDVKLPNDTNICHEAIINPIEISNIDPLPNYLWSTGDTSSSLTISQPGIYTLISKNICGNFSDEIIITGCQAKIYVPNVIDIHSTIDINTILKPYSVNAEIQLMEVFDRWGNQVFSQKAPITGWNGHFRGKECNSGVYVYYIKYKDLNNSEIHILKGDINLLK